MRIIFTFNHISIHKALAGLDTAVGAAIGAGGNFNPQGPRGPRLSPQEIILKKWYISIHKALAGLDTTGRLTICPLTHFNPQGPRGPRRMNRIEAIMTG